MTKKSSSILVSLGLLAISLILLLLFFIYKNNTGNYDNTIFSLQANNIDMQVGDQKLDYFYLTHKEASLDITTENEDIIYVDKEKIIGLKPGIANVSITASLENVTLSTEITVKVFNDDYIVKFDILEGGYFNNNILCLENEICQFKLELYDKLNRQMKNANFNIQLSQNNAIDYQFGNYIICCKEDCFMQIFANENIYFAFKIKYIEQNIAI